MISAFRLAGFELRRFRGALPKLALAFVALVPLLYGALYLWSNWDPYGRLDQVPVAVVNQDQAVSVDGRTVDAGDQFIAELQQEDLFDWHFVEEPEARDGLAAGRYYLVITVPPDFSANLASGAGNDPQRATLLLHRDDYNGFVIGKVSESVQTQLQSAIDRAAINAYFQAVFTNLSNLRQDTQDAADAASQLATGADTAAGGVTDLAAGLTSAKDGSSQLVSGLTTAQEGSAQLVTGATDAQQGATDLASGLGTAQSGADQLASALDGLSSGSADLVTGADQVATGTQELADTVGPALSAVSGAAPQLQAANSAFADLVDAQSGQATGSLAALTQLVSQLPAGALRDQITAQLTATTASVADAATAVDAAAIGLDDLDSSVAGDAGSLDAQLAELAAGAQQVASGALQLDEGLASASTGAADLSSGLSTSTAGVDSLNTGLTTLVDGATQLDSGITGLQTGAQQLDDGVGTAQTGVSSLADGVSQLDAGTRQLADQLATGVQRIPALTQDQTQNAVQVLSQPVQVSTVVDNAAGTYGRGLAPFFFSIALWVFGITAYLVLRPISGRALLGRASPVRLALAGWFPVVGLGLVGAALLLVVTWFGLGLDPVNVGISIGVIALAVVCFTALAALLRLSLGLVGTAITLVLLMVQLTSCAGIYPVETLPAPLRALHPFMPMTYLVDALRIAFTGGPADHLVRDVVVLAVVALLGLATCVLVVRVRQRTSQRVLHPPLG